jgi:hypothetical protein
MEQIAHITNDQSASVDSLDDHDPFAKHQSKDDDDYDDKVDGDLSSNDDEYVSTGDSSEADDNDRDVSYKRKQTSHPPSSAATVQDSVQASAPSSSNALGAGSSPLAAFPTMQQLPPQPVHINKPQPSSTSSASDAHLKDYLGADV